jgi:Protein of unknown function (DUF5656)
MQSRRVPLDAQRLSVLAALVVLGNGLSRLVTIPTKGFVLTVFNIQWTVLVNGSAVFLLLVGAVVAVGADSVLRTHPTHQQHAGGSRLQSLLHLILPATATLGGGLALSLFPSGPRWWVGMVAVSALVVLCVVGEYVVIDRSDYRYDLASVGLGILAYSLLALMLSAMHASETRLAVFLPSIALVVSVLALRLFELTASPGPRLLAYAGGTGWIIAQLALPLNFWPLPSVAFGLGLTVAAYCVIGVARSQMREDVDARTLVEYALVAAASILVLLLVVQR